MDEDIQNVLRQKIAWPWPQKYDEGYEQMKTCLLQNGYKKQSDPKLKKTWALEGALSPTEMGFGKFSKTIITNDRNNVYFEEAESGSDSEREDDDMDEEDEV